MARRASASLVAEIQRNSGGLNRTFHGQGAELLTVRGWGSRAMNWGTLGAPSASSATAELLHTLQTPVAALRHAHYTCGAVVPLHTHDCASLVYGVGGPCVEVAGSQQVIKRRLTYHPPGYTHALEFQGDTHVLAIEIEPATLDRHQHLAAQTASAPLLATAYDLIWRVLLQVAEGHSEQDIGNSLDLLIANVDASLARKGPAWMPDVLAALHVHWRDVPSTRGLAKKVGVSRQHLCRTFKLYTGVTIQQYAVSLRVDYARELLWWTGTKICEVAAETGFSDQSHLTRALGSHSGRTPARLRWFAPCLSEKRTHRD